MVTSRPLVLYLTSRGPARWMACCALVAAVVIALSKPSAAESCGHYVKRLGPGFVPGADAAKKVNEQSQQMAEHSVPTQAPCPCHGPQCRRAPAEQAPLSPQAPTRILTSQELVALADEATDFSPARSRFAGNFSCRPSRGYPLGTNRPPCA